MLLSFTCQACCSCGRPHQPASTCTTVHNTPTRPPTLQHPPSNTHSPTLPNHRPPLPPFSPPPFSPLSVYLPLQLLAQCDGRQPRHRVSRPHHHIVGQHNTRLQHGTRVHHSTSTQQAMAGCHIVTQHDIVLRVWGEMVGCCVLCVVCWVEKRDK